MKINKNFFIIEKDQITLEKYKNFFLNNKIFGSSIIFEGIVRQYNNNKSVSYIIYDIYYEYCFLKIKEIYLYCYKKYYVSEFLLVHKIGKVLVGEISLLLLIFSKHRKEGIYCCNYILDRIKLDVPIWKKEFYDNSNKNFWI